MRHSILLYIIILVIYFTVRSKTIFLFTQGLRKAKKEYNFWHI